jgi:hypothetical protein
LRAASLTSPALVNLQALLRRLSSICRSRMGSTVVEGQNVSVEYRSADNQLDRRRASRPNSSDVKWL